MAQVTSLFALDGLSRLLLSLVSSPCHPCPPDAYATLTGVDYARDRLWISPFNTENYQKQWIFACTSNGRRNDLTSKVRTQLELLKLLVTLAGERRPELILQ